MGISYLNRVCYWARLFVIAVVAAGTMAAWPYIPDASACGGPGRYEVAEPMLPISGLVGEMCNDWDGDVDFQPKARLRFLYPFRLVNAGSPEMDALWSVAYGEGGGAVDEDGEPGKDDDAYFGSPSLEGIYDSVGRGDYNAADSEARKAVGQLLDMPSTSADLYQRELSRALEYIEVRPFLDGLDPVWVRKSLKADGTPGESAPMSSALREALAVRDLDRSKVDAFIALHPDNPRMATLRFVALQERFKREIPDGWASKIRGAVPDATWDGLELEADAWLKDYPGHPLADLVRLWKDKVYYFKGDDEAAWKNILSVYPRRLPRVLSEMRYFIYQGMIPDSLVDRLDDPVLVTALVPFVETTPERWKRWWDLSESGLPKPLAANLQERLLAEADELAIPGRLPDGFPSAPTNPTQLWGKLRALCLMKAGMWDAAREEVYSLDPDEEQVLLAVTFHVRMGELTDAAAVKGIPDYIRQYLLRVLIDEDGLKALEVSADKTVVYEAVKEEGMRTAYTGRWDEAAAIVANVDPGRAALWRKAGKLGRDGSDSGRLEYARFLKDGRGRIFYEKDNSWYRSLDSRYDALEVYAPDGELIEDYNSTPGPWAMPWTPAYEREAILRDMTGGSEMFLALKAYVAWLETAKPSKRMDEAVKEADECYNWLINPSSGVSGFWSGYLEGHPLVVKLRKVGLRAKGVRR